jgi:hypothetical protein
MMLSLAEFIQLMQRDRTLVLVHRGGKDGTGPVALGETDSLEVEAEAFQFALQNGLLKEYTGPRWRLSETGKRWRPEEKGSV